MEQFDAARLSVAPNFLIILDLLTATEVANMVSPMSVLLLSRKRYSITSRALVFQCRNLVQNQPLSLLALVQLLRLQQIQQLFVGLQRG